MVDYIDRQAAIDVIDKILPSDPMKNEYTQGITCGAVLAMEYVKQLPSSQPEQKVGKWEYVDYGGFGNWHCTACRKMCICNGDYDYCPNCGAKMEVQNENKT